MKRKQTKHSETKPGVVPYHQLKHPGKKVTLEGPVVSLSGGRTVGVFRFTRASDQTKGDGFHVRIITAKQPDGRRGILEFNLGFDTAFVLSDLLTRQLQVLNPEEVIRLIGSLRDQITIRLGS